MCPGREDIWKSLIYFQGSAETPSYCWGGCFKIHTYFPTKHTLSLSMSFAYDWLHFRSASVFQGFVLIGCFQKLRLLIALSMELMKSIFPPDPFLALSSHTPLNFECHCGLKLGHRSALVNPMRSQLHPVLHGRTHEKE